MVILYYNKELQLSKKKYLAKFYLKLRYYKVDIYFKNISNIFLFFLTIFILSKTVYATTAVDTQLENRFVLCLIRYPVTPLEYDNLVYKSFMSTEANLEDNPVICMFDLESKHNMQEDSKYTIIAYVQLQIISNDLKVLTKQEENKLNNEHLPNDKQLSTNNEQTADISISIEEYELTPLANKESTKNNRHVYTIPDIQFKDEKIPVKISKLQIKRAITALCRVYSPMIPTTPFFILIETTDDIQSKILISKLNQDMRNLREDYWRIKNKFKHRIPAPPAKEVAIIRVTKKIVNFYIQYWSLAALSFGLATCMSAFTSAPIKNSLITYAHEPIKELDETCIVGGYAKTQRILDDAYTQGVLTQRFSIETALASDIINDLLAQNSTKNIFKKQFKTAIHYVGTLSPCECQFCKTTKSPAENNFSQNLLTVKLRADAFMRELEQLTRGKTQHPLYSDLPISGYFFKIHSLNDSLITPSCKECIPFQTNQSKNVGIIVASITTYIIGILSIPLFAFIFKVGKKYLSRQKVKNKP